MFLSPFQHEREREREREREVNVKSLSFSSNYFITFKFVVIMKVISFSYC